MLIVLVSDKITFVAPNDSSLTVTFTDHAWLQNLDNCMARSSTRLVAIAVVAGAWACPAASAQVNAPPGYRPVEITSSPQAFERSVVLNDAGQVVYESWLGGVKEGSEIFLWQDGRTERITNDSVRDSQPAIAPDGTIVWVRYMGPPGRFGPTGEIMMRTPDGVVTRVTDDAFDDGSPDINAPHHIVWQREMGVVCGVGALDIHFFNGTTIERISHDGLSGGVANLSARINDFDEIVWTRLEVCLPGDWDAIIMRHSAGLTETISTPEMFQPQLPSINNAGIVTWSHRDPVTFERPLVKWEVGEIAFLTYGFQGDINEHGDITFIRWHDNVQAWHVWLLRDGQLSQLTSGTQWNIDSSINNVGELTWASGRAFYADARYLQRYALGDLNCDGAVDAFDVEPFIEALVDPAGYAAEYPGCDRRLGDINQDNFIDSLDIEPFIGLLAP